MASSSETSETTTSPAVDARDVCDVAIVGAGPGGLAAALALQRRGYDVRVFERRRRFDRRASRCSSGRTDWST